MYITNVLFIPFHRIKVSFSEIDCQLCFCSKYGEHLYAWSQWGTSWTGKWNELWTLVNANVSSSTGPLRQHLHLLLHHLPPVLYLVLHLDRYRILLKQGKLLHQESKRLLSTPSSSVICAPTGEGLKLRGGGLLYAPETRRRMLASSVARRKSTKCWCRNDFY